MSCFHETTTGEGDMPVTCRFDFDADGEIEAIEVECHTAAKADHEERKFDTAIDNFIEGQQS